MKISEIICMQGQGPIAIIKGSVPLSLNYIFLLESVTSLVVYLFVCLCICLFIYLFVCIGRGGSIWYGIADSGCVMGIFISRDHRDEFRQGVDQVMRLITPMPSGNQYDVIFYPVVTIREIKGHVTNEKNPDSFVIGEFQNEILGKFSYLE